MAAFRQNHETPCTHDLWQHIHHFWSATIQLRERAFVSQRRLATVVGLPPSMISEIENGRRLPPLEKYVLSIGHALKASPSEQTALSALAAQERQSLGLKVGKATPEHVASLLRDIAYLSHQLSPAQASSIRAKLLEGHMAMK